MTHQRTELSLARLASPAARTELLAGGLEEVVERERASDEGSLLLEVVHVVQHLQAGGSVLEGGHGLRLVVRLRNWNRLNSRTEVRTTPL